MLNSPFGGVLLQLKMRCQVRLSRAASIALAVSMAGAVGCGQKDTPAQPSGAGDSGELSGLVGEGLVGEGLVGDGLVGDGLVGEGLVGEGQRASQPGQTFASQPTGGLPPQGSSAALAASGGNAIEQNSRAADNPPPTTAASTMHRGPQLPADWQPRQLVSFLGEVDQEMRLLITGRAGLTDAAETEQEIRRVVLLKRTASERLMQREDASAAQRVTGQRGFLQALSHLASMGDLRAAEELQAYAERFRNDPNPELRADSQLVLIGFAIESLRHGKQDAAEQVLRLVEELVAGDRPVDVATLMVLGQAKDTLLQYEYLEQATKVRQLIQSRFGSAEDAEVARMASMIAAAGFSQSDSALQQLDDLRQRLVVTAEPTQDAESQEAEPDAAVSVAQWQQALDEVLAQPADISMVEFLAGVSLEAEAVGRAEIAEATYRVLSKEFSQRPDALGQVARTALRARENREAVIGQVFDPDLPSVDGQPLRMTDYRGKVVLMPFWSSVFPDSLAVLPNLLEIQQQHPGRVSIVGINLDVQGANVQAFTEQQKLRFPSFRSESDPAADIVNEVAYRFGAVTLLFWVVIDPDGRVVHLDFSGGDLTDEVEQRIR